uniref:Uncharacterized protein n=1 Tax=Anopheles albimanus TaxID=7167 RepID=A0A182FY69_ANOAL
VCVCVCVTAGVYVCSPCNAGLLGCLIAGGGGVSLGLIFSFPATPSGGVRCTCQGHAIRHATQTTTTSSTSRSSSSKERYSKPGLHRHFPTTSSATTGPVSEDSKD